MWAMKNVGLKKWIASPKRLLKTIDIGDDVRFFSNRTTLMKTKITFFQIIETKIK